MNRSVITIIAVAFLGFAGLLLTLPKEKVVIKEVPTMTPDSIHFRCLECGHKNILKAYDRTETLY